MRRLVLILVLFGVTTVAAQQPSLTDVYAWLQGRVKSAVPQAVTPAPGAVGVSLTTALVWTATGATTVDLYGGTSGSPGLIRAGLTTTTYQPPTTLAPLTKYYWKIVAKNPAGTVTSPTWSFVTGVAPPTPPPSSASIHVTVGSNLQAALDAAPAGSTLLIDPGTYVGIRLRNKGTNAAVTTLLSSGALPMIGSRIAPIDAPQLVTLTSPDGGPALTADQGANGYLLRGFTAQPFGDGGVAFVQLGTDTEADPLKAPDNIVLDQWLLLASPATGGKRGFALLTRHATVSNSYCGGFWFSADSQCIIVWNGPGPFDILNNYLEASGENFLAGGADATSPAMHPANLTFRGNLSTKPLAWRGQANTTVKNAFELKAMQTALIEDNIFENVWVNGQIGFCLQFTPRNQTGRAPFTVVQDITFRHNTVRHCAGVADILGTSTTSEGGTTAPVYLRRVAITNTTISDIDPVKWGPGGPDCLINPTVDDPRNCTGKAFLLDAVPTDIAISGSTFTASKNLGTWLYITEGQAVNLIATDNKVPPSLLGIWGELGGFPASTTGTSVQSNNTVVPQ